MNSTFTINGFHIYHGFLSGYMNIELYKNRLNEINVFPVADGDTGNNMVRTIKTVLMGLPSQKSANVMLKQMADRSLEGARGNSGMILSQFITGFYRAGRNKKHMSVQDFCKITGQAVDFAYTSLEDPREGTILTVLRAWSDTLKQESLREISLKTLFTRGFAEARKALEKTTQQLKVLADNHVVDAGALGFIYFLEGIEKMHTEGPVSWNRRKSLGSREYIPSSTVEHAVSYHSHPSFRYCTEMLLENPAISAEQVRLLLKNQGDSLIVGKGDNRLRIHIHTDEPSVIASLLETKGNVIQQKVDDMVRQNQVTGSRKGRIAVVTDSIADISPEVLDTLQIHVIPLNLLWENREYLDRITISPEEFYRQQGLRDEFPSSSLPEITRIMTTFQFLADHYEGLIVLPVARALSGTWSQMVKAAEEFNREKTIIEVVDTKLNSAAQGLLVTEIAREAQRGAGLSELKKMAEDLRKRVKIYVSVSTFKYMVKGGRVTPLKGFIAGLLNLKPIVSLDAEGHGIAMDKAFSRQGLLKKINRIIEKTQLGPGIEHYCVVHALAEEKAAELASIVEKITGTKADYISSISPIVGMHSGKGAVAIGVIERPGRI